MNAVRVPLALSIAEKNANENHRRAVSIISISIRSAIEKTGLRRKYVKGYV